MRKKEFPCYEGITAILDCVSRQAVLLQNLAECGAGYPGWVATAGQKLRGLASAAHREWRELNEQLGRIFVTPIEREDVSALAREGMELAEAVAFCGALWRRYPPEKPAEWTARLAEGARLLRTVAEELPRIRGENAIAPRAGAIYAWRRDADRAFEGGDPTPTVCALYDCCRRLARMADTVEWIRLKNG